MSSDPGDMLDVLVTGAILHAERLADAGDAGAPAAYETVSRYEEALAAVHPADDVEGAVARVGAITAALRAGQRQRAHNLARRYEADPALSDARREEIAEALDRLAPGDFGRPDVLRRNRALVRSHFTEGKAA